MVVITLSYDNSPSYFYKWLASLQIYLLPVVIDNKSLYMLRNSGWHTVQVFGQECILLGTLMVEHMSGLE